jgi:hypothetical protein
MDRVAWRSLLKRIKKNFGFSRFLRSLEHIQCHPDRSEGSAFSRQKQIPRYARDDIGFVQGFVKIG